MSDIMIDIREATMDFHLEHENTNSFKEFFVNLLKGKIHYDHFRAVDHVNLQVKRGEVCGIIGRNGAGKSTLLKMIAGVLTPTGGSIHINGNIAPMLELGAGFDQDLTAKENIFLNGAILGYSKEFLQEKYDNIVEFSELRDFIDQPVRTYSSGMKMRLGFSININTDPEILVVDEALSVGDNAFKKKCKDAIKDLIARGTTVLYVSHNADSVQEVCRRAIYLKKGKLVFDGPVEQALELYRVDNPPKTAKGKKNPTPAERVANARKALAEKDTALTKAAAEKKAAEEELAAAEQAEALALKESDRV